MTRLLTELAFEQHSFLDIIKANGLYVDKTPYLIKLISSPEKVWFLSRPEGFGKSLLISTLEALFSGQRHLFQGLEMETKLDDKRFAPRPVISLDLSSFSQILSVPEIWKSLRHLIDGLATKHGIELTDSNSGSQANQNILIFRELIEKLAHKTGQLVAILIDDYDSPYLGLAQTPRGLSRGRQSLNEFYHQLKTVDDYVSFVFITGVSKFSVLDNATNISIMPEFGAICGFTHEELTNSFEKSLDDACHNDKNRLKLLLNKIQDYYGGFCFDGQTHLYNPLSITRCFRDNKFKSSDYNNYWYHKNRSPLLTKCLEGERLTPARFRGTPISFSFASDPGEIDLAKPLELLYHEGYLTLRPGDDENPFKLVYPNIEVNLAVSRILTRDFTGSINSRASGRQGFINGLKNRRPDILVRELNRFLTTVFYIDSDPSPYFIENIKPIVEFEKSTLLEGLDLALRMSGLKYASKIKVSQGILELAFGFEEVKCAIEIQTFQQDGADEAVALEAFNELVRKTGEFSKENLILLGLAINESKIAITAWWDNILELPLTDQGQALGNFSTLTRKRNMFF
ncbi:MAG: AAA family ATPase [Deltaproteobacteria bacterium]|jgi:hypothetical protein|nr:AAA family ATPase [Deltaproteobacteria bacterium]